MNEVIKNIMERRSTRSFKLEQIKDEDLNAILTAGAYAPSGMNLQLWKFTAIKNAEILKALKKTVRDVYRRLYVHKDEESYIKNHLIKNVADDYDFMYNAPTLVILSAPLDAAMGMPDCAAAIENMMLAATSLGIGSCWINQIRWLSEQPDMKAELVKLGIPEKHTVNCSLSLGYTDKPTPLKPRKENVIKIIE